MVDPAKVGFPLLVLMAFDVSREKAESVMSDLADRPEVKWVMTTTGRYDILTLMWFASTDQLSDFVEKELPAIDGVKDTETFICLQVKKGHYLQV